MAPIPETANSNDWHRYFAIEANNRAWDLAVATRTPAQDQDMLDNAHAAAWHWQFAGETLHHMRAAMLLAEVHALLGMGATAMTYAEAMRSYFLAQAEVPDWELAFVHTIHAHAAGTLGDAAVHATSYAAATAALEAIADAEDRAIVQATFDLVAPP